MSIRKQPVAGDDETGDGAGLDLDQLLARVAWHYYIEGLTQSEIAVRLGLHRLRVNRLLARSRRDGIVRVTLHSRHAGCLDAEMRLASRFGLRRVLVVPAPADPTVTQDMVGAAIGHYLNERLEPGTRLGIVSGRTLYGALQTLVPRPLPGMEIVSLVGGLTRRARLLPFEAAHRLAQMYDASCYYVPAPVYAESVNARDEFMAQALVREVLQRAAAVDIAMVGVGRLTAEGVIRTYDLVAPEDVEEAQAMGAVGSFVGRLIDAQGVPVVHRLNDEVVGLPLDRLRHVGEVVVCGGGAGKAEALRAVLTAGYADVLITDEIAAELL